MSNSPGRAFVLASALFLAAPRHAFAAPPNSPPPKGNSGVGAGKISPTGELSAAVASKEAQARAARGDCKGALDAYDDALRTSIAPELYRDRGKCHEQLGHRYPAMDDYRAYLTARPNAADAPDIRARLAALGAAEGAAQNGQADSASSAKADASSDGASVSFSADTRDDPKGNTRGRPVAQAEADEARTDESKNSPLRTGTGVVIGAYGDFRRWFESRLGWGQGVGLTLRGSLSPVSTIWGEIGYSAINGEGSASSASGAAVAAGYEARLALDPWVDNAILLGAGVGYENMKRGATGHVSSIFAPRARFGFRHVFGPALGLEANIEGGAALVHVQDLPDTAENNTFEPFVGLRLALVVGF